MTESLKKKPDKITFRKEPIQIFGHVFTHPFPLEMSLIKYCYMGCVYCFSCRNKDANEDVYGEKDDPVDKFLRLLDKANGKGYDPQNFIEYCIHHKYGIIFSNNVDPFLPGSEKKYKLGERVLKACLQYKQPLYIQTKVVYPNETVKDLLIEGKDIFHLYVTFTTLDEETAKRYDTPVVLPDERLRRVKVMTDAGVHVTAALNPYVPEWVGNVDDYFKALSEVGVKGFWWHPLHLTRKQKAATPKSFAPYNEMDLAAREVDQWFDDRPIIKKIAAKYGIRGHFINDHDPENLYNGVTLWDEEQMWPIDGNRLFQFLYKQWLEIKKPIYVEWDLVNAFYEVNDVWNKAFKVGQIQSVLAGDSSGHQAVRSSLGKINTIKNIMRFLFNNPHDHAVFLSECFYLHQLVEYSVETEEVHAIMSESGDLTFVFDPSLEHCNELIWDQFDLNLPEPVTLEIRFEDDE